MARTPEQQAALDAARAAKAQAPIPEFTTSPGAAPTPPPAPEPAAPRGARAARPVNPPMGTMYGTAQGVATDLGAAEAAQRYAQPQAPSKVPPVGARDPYGAGAWQAERAAQEARSAAAPAQQAAGSWTEKLNARTAAMNEATAARQAAHNASLANAAAKVQGIKDFGSAGMKAAESFMAKPVIKGAGRAIGGYSAGVDALDARQDFSEGRVAEGLDKTGTAVAGAASMGLGAAGAAGTAGALGGAYLVGHGIGTHVVNPILDNTEGGRSFKNSLGAGMNKVANLFGGGVDGGFDDRAAAMLNGTAPPAAQGARQPAPAAPAAQTGPNFSPEHVALMKERYGTPQQAAAPTGGLVSRQGNNLSGMNVKEGWQYEDGPGTRAPKMGFTTMDMSEGRRQDALELQRLQSERAQREAGFAGNQPGGGLAGFGGGTLSSGLRDKVNREATPDMSGMSNRQRAQMMMNDRQLAQAREMAQMQDATQRYGTDTSAKATMRGQDMQLMGHKMTNQIALANRQYEMFKDQRNYELDVKKFGQTQADANRAARESEDKAWTASAEKRFVTKVDGKDVVDANKVAEFTKAADATVPEFIKLLQQTGTPQALAKAKELSARGKAALGPEDHNMLHKLMEMREVSRAGHGWQPGKGAHIETDNLLAYLPKGKDTGLFGNPITVTEGGSRIPTNKLEYGPDDNAWLPTFQPRRTDLTSIR